MLCVFFCESVGIPHRSKSPTGLYRKLQCRESSVGLGDLTRSWKRVSELVHDGAIVVGRGSVRVIDDVEKVGEKLSLERFGDSRKRNVLRQRNVEPNQSRPGKTITPASNYYDDTYYKAALAKGIATK